MKTLLAAALILTALAAFPASAGEASGTVRYQVTFIPSWNPQTHHGATEDPRAFANGESSLSQRLQPGMIRSVLSSDRIECG